MSVHVEIVVGVVCFAVFAPAQRMVSMIAIVKSAVEGRRIDRENAEAQLRYEIESEICRRHGLKPPFPPNRLTRW